MSGHLQGRVAFVTGASRGIGAELAKGLAGQGAHVVLAARTVGGLEEVDDAIQAAGGTATLLPLNLAATDKLTALGPTLLERFGRVDIFVGNAAMLGDLTPISQYEPRQWDEVINTNLNANQRLIRTLDPLLRASNAGRAVFLTSGVARAPNAYWGAYAVSKAGLECMVKIYAAETAKTNLRVNLLDPGIVRTAMRAKAFPGEDQSQLNPPSAVLPTLLDMVMPNYTGHGQIVTA